MEWPCEWSGPIGHFARHSSCSTFRLLLIYFLPSKIVPWLSLLTVNHTDSLSWKPMLNFMFQKSPRMGRPQKKKRSRKWVSLRLPPRESKWTELLHPLLYPFSLLAVTVVTSFCADYCKYHSFSFFLEKSVESSSLAFSGRLDWRICWTLFCSKIFYRYDFITHSCKWMPNLVLLLS